jgi:hypothetical protein
MLDDINQSGAYRPCKGRIANGFINSEVHSINFALPAQAAPSLFIRHLGATERVPDALELRFRVARVAENTLPGPRVEGSVLAGAEHNLPAITPPRNLQLDSLADETTASGGEMCTFNQLINSPAEGSDNLGLRETPQPDSPQRFHRRLSSEAAPWGSRKRSQTFFPGRSMPRPARRNPFHLTPQFTAHVERPRRRPPRLSQVWKRQSLHRNGLWERGRPPRMTIRVAHPGPVSHSAPPTPSPAARRPRVPMKR